MITAEEMDALRRFFLTRSEVAMSFLFGSQARGTFTPLSDVDIAVYFQPNREHSVEYEEAIRYGSESEIQDGCERILNREVELLILNRATPSVAAGAVRGIPLALGDFGLYLDFLLVVGREAEDFREGLFRDFLENRGHERRTETQTT